MNIIKKHSIRILEPKSYTHTLVFTNGFGTDQSYWTEIANHFKDRYKIVLSENIGSSKTDLEYYSPNKYDNLRVYSNDLLEICKSLEIQNAILVGHSVSAMIGLLGAIKEKKYFSNLVLLGASPRYLNDSDYHGGFNPEDLEGLFTAMETNYYAWASGFAKLAMNTPDDPSLAEYFSNGLSAIQPNIAISVAKTIFYSDHRNDLPNLPVPSLILKTKEDIAVPDGVAEYMQAKIPGSQLVELDAKGHFPHLSAPKEIIQALDAYLKK